MRHSLCNKRLNAQRGDALIEALIGLVLMTVISLGLAIVMSKTLANQRNTSVGVRTLLEMRQLASDTGVASLCTSGTGTTSSQVTVNASCTTIASITVDPKKADGSSLGISGAVANTTMLQSLTTSDNSESAASGIKISP